MTETFETIVAVRARDGKSPPARRWSPPGAVRATMVVSHGMGEHSSCHFPAGLSGAALRSWNTAAPLG